MDSSTVRVEFCVVYPPKLSKSALDRGGKPEDATENPPRVPVAIDPPHGASKSGGIVEAPESPSRAESAE